MSGRCVQFEIEQPFQCPFRNKIARWGGYPSVYEDTSFYCGITGYRCQDIKKFTENCPLKVVEDDCD